MASASRSTRHHDVLDDHRRAGRAHAAHRREQALAQLPVLRRARRGSRVKSGGASRRTARERRQRARDRRVERGLVRLAELDQQRRGAVADRERLRAVPGLRPQRGRVHDLQRGRARRRERRHRGPRLAQLGEVEQRGGARGRIGHRAQRDVGHEAQRALRADHQVGQDVRRPVVVQQRLQAVAGGVLAREPAADRPRAAARRRAPRRASAGARRARPGVPRPGARPRPAARCPPRCRRPA